MRQAVLRLEEHIQPSQLHRPHRVRGQGHIHSPLRPLRSDEGRGVHGTAPSKGGTADAALPQVGLGVVLQAPQGKARGKAPRGAEGQRAEVPPQGGRTPRGNLLVPSSVEEGLRQGPQGQAVAVRRRGAHQGGTLRRHRLRAHSTEGLRLRRGGRVRRRGRRAPQVEPHVCGNRPRGQQPRHHHLQQEGRAAPHRQRSSA